MPTTISTPDDTRVHDIVVKWTTHRVVTRTTWREIWAYIERCESHGDELRDVACAADCWCEDEDSSIPASDLPFPADWPTAEDRMLMAIFGPTDEQRRELRRRLPVVPTPTQVMRRRKPRHWTDSTGYHVV